MSRVAISSVQVCLTTQTESDAGGGAVPGEQLPDPPGEMPLLP